MPAAATHGLGRRTLSRLRLLLCLIYQLGFRGVAIRVAKENGGAACAWPSSAGWLRTSSHCASSRWAHLPVREGGVLLACALHVSGGPRVRHHGFIGSDQHFRTKAKVFHELVFIYLVDSGYQFHYSGENLRIFIAADKIVTPSDKLPSKEFD